MVPIRGDINVPVPARNFPTSNHGHVILNWGFTDHPHHCNALDPVVAISLDMTRPATHAGTWYQGEPFTLRDQIDSFLANLALTALQGARVVVAPHAGYAYSGACLGKLFAAWDCADAETVFILGPSHHVYFRDLVKLTTFSSYDTPLGAVPVDTRVVQDLHHKHPEMFSYMDRDIDEDEHSIEMLVPFLVRAIQNLARSNKLPKIVPILISGMDERLATELAIVLGNYAHDARNSFLVSSDFCHWGSRFRYTQFWDREPSETSFVAGTSRLLPVNMVKHPQIPIHQSIEGLDKGAMAAASLTDYSRWREHMELTENTICGEKAIGVIILMMQREFSSNLPCPRLMWTGYAQSGRVTSPKDSSVSYASGYAILAEPS